MDKRLKAVKKECDTFDWGNSDARSQIDKIRQLVETLGINLEDPHHVETISEGFLEPAWEKIGREEATLIAQLKDEFRKAGATEAQLTWGMVDNVPLGYAARKRVDRICRQLDELKEKAFPIMCLAVVFNEAREAM